MTTVQKGSVALVVALMAVTAGAALQEEENPAWLSTNRFLFLSQGIGFVDKYETFRSKPAFQDLIPRWIPRPRRLENGKWSYPLGKPPWKNPDGTPKPFYMTLMTRVFGCPGMFYLAEMDPGEKGRYLEFKAKHPEMVEGIQVTEWANDAMMFRRGTRKFPDRKSKKPQKLPRFGQPFFADDYARTLSTGVVARAYDNRGAYVDYLKSIFDRTVELDYGVAKDLWPGDGQFCVDHLTADWGAGQLWVETSRNYMHWQIQLMFGRGAAAQYQIPFNWYLAAHYSGYASDGTRNIHGDQFADSLDRGISLSAVTRTTYLTYLSGSRVYEREGGDLSYVYTKGERKGQMAPEGEMYERFWQFCQDNPRGVPYRPIAIVVPRDRGYTRLGGKAFYTLFPYTPGDHQLDVLMSVVLEWPKNRAPGMAKGGIERVMSNSKYGDVFDVIVPGGEHPETFRRALLEHKVAFLAGDFDFDPETQKALDRFVAEGGKLCKMADLVGEWPGADKAFANLFPHEFDIWEDFNVPDDYPAHFTGLEKTFAAADRLVLPEHPFTVTGDVQFGFNRLKDGWLVYLINNAGVKKFSDKAEEIAPGGSKVVLDLARIPHGREVAELVEKTPVAVRADGKLELTVPYGGIRVVRIR